MSNFTKKELAEFFGVTTETIRNHEKEASKGSKQHKHRLEAYKSYFLRYHIENSENFKELTDQDGKKVYIIFD